MMYYFENIGIRIYNKVKSSEYISSMAQTASVNVRNTRDSFLIYDICQTSSKSGMHVGLGLGAGYGGLAHRIERAYRK